MPSPPAGLIWPSRGPRPAARLSTASPGCGLRDPPDSWPGPPGPGRSWSGLLRLHRVIGPSRVLARSPGRRGCTMCCPGSSRCPGTGRRSSGRGARSPSRPAARAARRTRRCPASCDLAHPGGPSASSWAPACSGGRAARWCWSGLYSLVQFWENGGIFAAAGVDLAAPAAGHRRSPGPGQAERGPAHRQRGRAAPRSPPASGPGCPASTPAARCWPCLGPLVAVLVLDVQVDVVLTGVPAGLGRRCPGSWPAAGTRAGTGPSTSGQNPWFRSSAGCERDPHRRPPCPGSASSGCA